MSRTGYPVGQDSKNRRNTLPEDRWWAIDIRGDGAPFVVQVDPVHVGVGVLPPSGLGYSDAGKTLVNIGLIPNVSVVC